jgi:hypothetical protein
MYPRGEDCLGSLLSGHVKGGGPGHVHTCLHLEMDPGTYNCSLIKMDWLDTCITLRLDDAFLVVFIQCWCKGSTILLSMGSQG